MPSESSGGASVEPAAKEHALRVSAALFDELRAHCDRNGVRLAVFIEEALEKATYVDELETLLHDGPTMLAKLEAEHDRGVGLGFGLGVLAATLALQGLPETGRRLTPERSPLPMSRPTSGEQIELFA